MTTCHHIYYIFLTTRCQYNFKNFLKIQIFIKSALFNLHNSKINIADIVITL